MKARTKMKTLLLLGVLLFGFTVSAQSQKVSLDFKNERVEKVLASIKSQTGMSLVLLRRKLSRNPVLERKE